MAPRKYAYIDALRGLAFLGVFACHVQIMVSGLPTLLGRVASHGNKGVQLFFMVSALTLFLSFRARQTEPRAVRNFFIRRFFRIAPLFYLGLLVYPLLLSANRLLPGETHRSTTAGALATLTFLHGWSPYWINRVVPGGWSIAVEMNFYLLVPFLFRTLRTPARTVAVLLLAQVVGVVVTKACVLALMTFLGRADTGQYLFFGYYWFPYQFSTFLCGILAFQVIEWVRRDGSAFDAAVSGRLGRALPLVLLGFAAYLLVSLAVSTVRPTIELLLYDCGLFLVIVALALEPNRLLVNRWTSYLGKVSFSAYLTHFAVLYLARDLLESESLRGFRLLPWCPRAALIVSTTLAVTVVLSTITYHLIECPGQALGRRLIAWLDRQPVPAGAAPAGHVALADGR